MLFLNMHDCLKGNLHALMEIPSTMFISSVEQRAKLEQLRHIDRYTESMRCLD